jgi:2-methylisocitrate lyase-like PEP mutase family enzyme
MLLTRTSLPEVRRPALKRLLQQPRLLRAIECHNPLSAMLGATATGSGTNGSRPEFDVLWASGFSHASALALPDAELSTIERRLDAIADIAAATDKPIIADGDTGGDAMAFGYLCRRLEDLGVSGVIVEDKSGAKRTSLAEGANHELEDPHAFCSKIAHAKQRLLSDDFLIFARIESLIAGAGLADALARAEIYVRERSADGVVIHSKDATGEEALRFMEGYRRIQAQAGISKPLVCIPTAYNHITGAELHRHGVRIVIHGNHLIRAAYRAMKRAAELILENDRSAEADEVCAPVKELFASIGVESADLGRSPPPTSAGAYPSNCQ